MEDQERLSHREYELVSSSFFELAMQFIAMKNEMNKKLNLSAVNRTWLENERAKIFPFEK